MYRLHVVPCEDSISLSYYDNDEFFSIFPKNPIDRHTCRHFAINKCYVFVYPARDKTRVLFTIAVGGEFFDMDVPIESLKKLMRLQMTLNELIETAKVIQTRVKRNGSIQKIKIVSEFIELIRLANENNYQCFNAPPIEYI